jgi:hypothetical protein
VFLLNSRLEHLCATTSGYEPYRGTPSPEVTGLICRVPSAEFSQTPEDSLLDYLCRFAVRTQIPLLSSFSRQCRIRTFRQNSWAHANRTSLAHTLESLHTAFHNGASLPSCVPASYKRPIHGAGILTSFPSPTPFGLGLGTD